MNTKALYTLALLFGLACSPTAHAQATRTWVSGVGDDVNPCSRTAPCKTFAGAISKTAAGGEISVLDPGGYGAVTITKSITIDGGEGAGWGSILNSFVAAVVINAAPADTVTLRNLSMNGAGTGLAGVRILSAGKVFIERCQIFGNGGSNPNGRGISDVRTNGGQLFVTDTAIRNNSQSGIVILPASGAMTIDATIRRVHLIGNGNAGLAASIGSMVTITDSIASGNGSYGIYAETSTVHAADTTMSDNYIGLFVGGTSPAVRLSNVVITNNGLGLAHTAGVIYSYGNNKIAGNANSNTAGFSPVGMQ